MRVIVLGAGVIGTTTAYYLAQSGCQVEVYDRQAGVAQETSFANAGQLSFGYSSPWAAPGIPLQACKWLLQSHSPFTFRPSLKLEQYLWMLQLLLNCRQQAYMVNKERMLRLAEYSRHCLHQLERETQIQYQGRSLGTTQLLRNAQQRQNIASDLRVLEQLGVAFRVLKPSEIEEVEPALSQRTATLAGAVHFPNDQTGDCYLFTQHLQKLAQQLGVKFCFEHDVWRFEQQGNEIKGIWIEGELKQADHYVVALGSFSRRLLTPLSLPIPLYPFKGYSLTADLRYPECAPVSTVLDEGYKVAITRFDNRIRVGGMAELVGYDLSLNRKRQHTLVKVAQQLFPDAAEYQQGEFWCGLRPATPDSVPLLGKAGYDNLWLNTGHGTLGWTMACGSGRYLADLMMTKQPEISTEGLSVQRFSGKLGMG